MMLKRAATVVATTLAVLAVWYLGAWLMQASGDVLASSKLPYPHDILRPVLENPGTLLDASWMTLSTAVLGFAIGGLFGVLVSVFMARARWIEATVFPYLLLAKMMPLIALVPLIRSIVKSDNLTRLLMAAFVTFFVVTLSALRGLKDYAPAADELFSVYNVGNVKRLRYLRFPTSMPYIFSGLKLAAPLSLVGAIVVELMNARSGLGFLMLSALTFGPAQAPMLWAAMLVTLAMGLALAYAVVVAERLCTPWQPRFRSEGASR